MFVALVMIRCNPEEVAQAEADRLAMAALGAFIQSSVQSLEYTGAALLGLGYWLLFSWQVSETDTNSMRDLITDGFEIGAAGAGNAHASPVGEDSTRRIRN